MSEGKWELSRISQAEFGALKRCAGIPYGSDMRAAQAFFHAANDVYENQISAWYGALCMQCLWKQEEVKRTLPFAEILRTMYRDPNATDSMRKRCTSFLDIPMGEDGFLLGKLCALARMMRNNDGSVMPDFDALASDLYNWNNMDRFVQRRWIKTICATISVKENDDNNKEDINNVD